MDEALPLLTLHYVFAALLQMEIVSRHRVASLTPNETITNDFPSTHLWPEMNKRDAKIDDGIFGANDAISTPVYRPAEHCVLVTWEKKPQPP